MLALPLAAQERVRRDPPADPSLAARTHAFLRARLNGADSAAPYFPRQGDWTWVNRRETGYGRTMVGRWRFRGADAERVLAHGGPMCDSWCGAATWCQS